MGAHFMEYGEVAGDFVGGAQHDRDPMTSLLIRVGFVLTILWLVSGFKSCQDMRYSAWGRSAAGRVTKITEERSKHSDVIGYTVAYSFYPPGAEREPGESSIGVADRPRYHVGQELEIEFLDGRYPDSRMKGSNNPWWPRFFIGFSIAMLLCVLILSILAWREEKKPRRRRRV